MTEERVTVEILISGKDRKISVTGTDRDIFAVVRGLKEDHHEPTIRYHDEEMGEPTCWQPTSIEPERKAA
jgi:hypothetical protein